MFGKILMASTMLFPAFAMAQGFENIFLDNTSGNCPHSITMGVLGDSFAGGVRYTLDIKNLVQAGTVRVAKGPANHPGYSGYRDSVEYVIFTAALRPAWRSCVSDTFVSGFTMNEKGVVRISLRNGTLRYVFKDSDNVIRNPSTYNNQAILFYSEFL